MRLRCRHHKTSCMEQQSPFIIMMLVVFALSMIHAAKGILVDESKLVGMKCERKSDFCSESSSSQSSSSSSSEEPAYLTHEQEPSVISHLQQCRRSDKRHALFHDQQHPQEASTNNRDECIANHCGNPIENTFEVNLDENTEFTEKDEFNFIETMSDSLFPPSIGQTLIETRGEVRINNHSDQYVLQIFEIIPDSNMISLEKTQEDIQPHKERVIKFSVIPEASGEEQEINLYFKIRFYDQKRLKPISSRTVQFTILLQNVRQNKFGLKPQNEGNILLNSIAASSPPRHLRLFNPLSVTLQTKELIFLKNHLYFSSSSRSSGSSSLNSQAKSGVDFVISPKLEFPANREYHISDIAIHANATGSFCEYLRIAFENSSLVFRIPIRFRVIAESLSFHDPFLYFGVFTSKKGHHSRTIRVDNPSQKYIEISDIQLLFDAGRGCAQVNAIFDANSQSTERCLGASERNRIIIPPGASKVIIGKIHMSPVCPCQQETPSKLQPSPFDSNCSLDCDRFTSVVEGRIRIITNYTDIDSDFKFIRHLHGILSYEESLSEFSFDDHSKQPPPTKQRLQVKNIFNSQVKVTGLLMPHASMGDFQSDFEITEFQEKILEIGDEKTIFSFQFLQKNQSSSTTTLPEKSTNTYLLLQLNQNVFVPIFFSISTNTLTCIIPAVTSSSCLQLANSKPIDFGNKALNQTASIIFKIKNSNQITLPLSLNLNSTRLTFSICAIISDSGNPIDVQKQVNNVRYLEEPIELDRQQAVVISISLNTSEPGRSSGNDFLQISSLNEDASVYLDYEIVDGEIGLEPTSIHFSHSPNRSLKEQKITVLNFFPVYVNLLAVKSSDPRFVVDTIYRSIEGRTSLKAISISFNQTEAYGRTLQSANEDSFISVEDLIALNNAQTSEKSNFVSAEIKLTFDLDEIVMKVSADIHKSFRLVEEKAIEFSNAEMNQFYSKPLHFKNPLDTPVSFQLHIATENILTAENYITKQFQTQQEVDFVFCVPIQRYKTPLVKEVYDSLSELFVNSKIESTTEIQDPEVLSQIQSHPEIDHRARPNFALIAEVIRQISPLSSEKQESNTSQQSASTSSPTLLSNNNNNNNNNNKNQQQHATFPPLPPPLVEPQSGNGLGYTCKEGTVSSKVKFYLEKVEFNKQLAEFSDEPEKKIKRILELFQSVQSIKREITEISSTTRARPSLYNYNMRTQKSLWEKIAYFFSSRFLLSDFSSIPSFLISEWQSAQPELNGLYHRGIRATTEATSSTDLSDSSNTTTTNTSTTASSTSSTATGSTSSQQTTTQSAPPNNPFTAHQQQFFLSSEVLNKTFVLQARQSIELNTIIFIPKSGNARNNLIIKSNMSSLDIIPISGRSGVTRLRVIDIKHMSPILFGPMRRKASQLSSADINYKEFIEKYIQNQVFIFSMTEEQLVGSVKHRVDIIKRFVIKNEGDFPISIKNVFIETQPCAAYGFFIVNCGSSWKLEPNQEKSLNIGYKSDYPYDTIQRTIHFYTSTYRISFPIRAEFFGNREEALDREHNPNNGELRDTGTTSTTNAVAGTDVIEGSQLFDEEHSEQILLAFLENFDKTEPLVTKVVSEQKKSDEWAWLTDSKVQEFLAKTKASSNERKKASTQDRSMLPSSIPQQSSLLASFTLNAFASPFAIAIKDPMLHTLLILVILLTVLFFAYMILFLLGTNIIQITSKNIRVSTPTKQQSTQPNRGGNPSLAGSQQTTQTVRILQQFSSENLPALSPQIARLRSELDRMKRTVGTTNNRISNSSNTSNAPRSSAQTNEEKEREQSDLLAQNQAKPVGQISSSSKNTTTSAQGDKKVVQEQNRKNSRTTTTTTTTSTAPSKNQAYSKRNEQPAEEAIPLTKQEVEEDELKVKKSSKQTAVQNTKHETNKKAATTTTTTTTTTTINKSNQLEKFTRQESSHATDPSIQKEIDDALLRHNQRSQKKAEEQQQQQQQQAISSQQPIHIQEESIRQSSSLGDNQQKKAVNSQSTSWVVASTQKPQSSIPTQPIKQIIAQQEWGIDSCSEITVINDDSAFPSLHVGVAASSQKSNSSNHVQQQQQSTSVVQLSASSGSQKPNLEPLTAHKKVFLVQDHISSCGEEEEDEFHHRRRNQPIVAVSANAAAAAAAAAVASAVVLTQTPATSSNRQQRNNNNNNNNNNNKRNSHSSSSSSSSGDGSSRNRSRSNSSNHDNNSDSSKSSQLSSGDSLSSEEFDTLKRSNEHFDKVIGVKRDDQLTNELSSSNISPNLKHEFSRQGSDEASFTARSAQVFFPYESESSEDESALRRHFNVFSSPSPCFYPIQFLEKHAAAATTTETQSTGEIPLIETKNELFSSISSDQSIPANSHQLPQQQHNHHNRHFSSPITTQISDATSTYPAGHSFYSSNFMHIQLPTTTTSATHIAQPVSKQSSSINKTMSNAAVGSNNESTKFYSQKQSKLSPKNKSKSSTENTPNKNTQQKQQLEKSKNQM